MCLDARRQLIRRDVVLRQVKLDLGTDDYLVYILICHVLLLSNNQCFTSAIVADLKLRDFMNQNISAQ